MEYSDIIDVEDSLIKARIFINPNSRETTAPNAYMTVVDFALLEEWVKKREFTAEKLSYCCRYWRENRNIGPSLKVLATMIEFWRPKEK